VLRKAKQSSAPSFIITPSAAIIPDDRFPNHIRIKLTPQLFPLHTLVHLDLLVTVRFRSSARCTSLPPLDDRHHTKRKADHPRKPRNRAECCTCTSYIADLGAAVSHRPNSTSAFSITIPLQSCFYSLNITKWNQSNTYHTEADSTAQKHTQRDKAAEPKQHSHALDAQQDPFHCALIRQMGEFA
jgi:hypothetical protein